jgi:hypothetical protein
MSARFSLLLCGFIGLAGCSSGSSGGNGGGTGLVITPLSVAQQKRFDQTALHVSTGAQWKGYGTGAAIAPIENKIALEQSVASNCAFDAINEATPAPIAADPSVSSSKSGFETSGAACPISAGFLNADSTTSSQSKGSYDDARVFSIHYAALTDVAKNALDIQSYNYTMNLKTGTMDGMMMTTGNGSGQIVSKVEGILKLGYTTTASYAQTGMTMTSSSTLTYPDGLVVEIKSVQSSSQQGQTIDYYLNGKLIDGPTYNMYMMQFGINHMQGYMP